MVFVGKNKEFDAILKSLLHNLVYENVPYTQYKYCHTKCTSIFIRYCTRCNLKSSWLYGSCATKLAVGTLFFLHIISLLLKASYKNFSSTW